MVVSRTGTQIKLRIFTFPKQRKQAAIPSPAGLTVHPIHGDTEKAVFLLRGKGDIIGALG